MVARSVADFNIRLTVWSLVNKSSTYLKAPKFPSKGLTFSPDGGFMALAERRECKDFVSVFSTAAWCAAPPPLPCSTASVEGVRSDVTRARKGGGYKRDLSFRIGIRLSVLFVNRFRFKVAFEPLAF